MRQTLLALALLIGCAQGTTEARVRSALDLLADVVDPSYKLAVDGCIAREGDAVRRAEAGSDAAIDEYESVKARCHAVRVGFDTIRRGHATAAELVEKGKVAEAEREIERVRAAFRGLPTPAIAKDGGTP